MRPTNNNNNNNNNTPEVLEALATEFDEERDGPLLRKLWSLGHAALAEDEEDDEEAPVVRHTPPPFERTSERWTQLGFQRDDPVSDLRGGGVLALRNLVRFLESQPQFANAVLRSRVPQKEFDPRGFYPFAAAGVNMTKVVADLGPLEDFDECYALAFRLLDRNFDRRDASYLQFNAILKETTDVLAKALASQQGLAAALRLAAPSRSLPAIRGVLRKLPTTGGVLGTRRVAQWRCRYFVLRGDTVAWYKPASDRTWRKAEVNGDFQAEARCVRQSLVVDRPGDPRAFKVEPMLKGGTRVKLRLRADDPAVAAAWKRAFQSVIDRLRVLPPTTTTTTTTDVSSSLPPTTTYVSSSLPPTTTDVSSSLPPPPPPLDDDDDDTVSPEVIPPREKGAAPEEELDVTSDAKARRRRRDQEPPSTAWVSCTDKQDRVYFLHVPTGETQWHLPPGWTSAASGWAAKVDDKSGRIYYFLPSTGDTAWALPVR